MPVLPIALQWMEAFGNENNSNHFPYHCAMVSRFLFEAICQHLKRSPAAMPGFFCADAGFSFFRRGIARMRFVSFLRSQTRF